MVNLRVSAVGTIPRPRLRRLERASADSTVAVKHERNVYFDELGAVTSCKIYDRYRLRQGNRIDGPAIVEEVDSTVVIHPGYYAEVDVYGKVTLNLQPGDVISYRTPGGGGYGPAHERDPELVLNDYIAERVSRQRARDIYGVVIDAQTRLVDSEATEQLRRQLAS